MDENAFFRDATKKICGSLNIETAIRRGVEILSSYMPVFGIHVGRFDSKLGALRTYASCRLDGGKDLKELLPMPPKGLNLKRRTMFELGSSMIPVREQSARLLQVCWVNRTAP